MLLLLDLPISKINAQDQSDLKVLMQIDENTNLIEYLRDKLVNPSEAYLREKILIDSKHDTIVNQDINLQEVISTTNTPETAFDLQSDSPNVGSNQPIETAESRNEVASLKLVDINLAREISENEINIASMKDSIALVNQKMNEVDSLKLVDISLAREISENESDIASMKDSIALINQIRKIGRNFIKLHEYQLYIS